MKKPDKITIYITGSDYTIAAIAGNKVLLESVVEYRPNGTVESVLGEELFEALPVDLAAMLDDLDVHLSDIAGALYSHGGAA